MNPIRKIIIPPENPILKTQKEVSGDFSKAYSEMYRNTMEEKENFESETRNKINLIISSDKPNIEIQNNLEILRLEIEVFKGKAEYSFERSVIDKMISEEIIPQRELYTGLIRMGSPNPNYVIKKEIQGETQINSESALNTPQISINSDLMTENPRTHTNLITKIKPSGLTFEQITSWFNRLHQNLNPINGEPFMLKKDIDLLLNLNIEGYGDKKEPACFIEFNFISGKQTILFYSFIYHFYHKNERNYGGTKVSYALFIKNNFEYFKDHNLTNLCKNIKPHTKLAKKYPWAF